jgi:8-oxo-dGTP pyrophosphatase MutT (NUDIX family)
MDYKTLTNTYEGKNGVTYYFEYTESDTFDHILESRIEQAYGICFHGDNIVVVNNIEKPGSYTPVGGTVETGEHPDRTLIREIQEESNMNVLAFKPIGYQKVTDTKGSEPFYQLRYVCIVEPYGPFVSDPAGKVTEVIEVHPNEYKKYFDWGEIGDAIIDRALQLRQDM